MENLYYLIIVTAIIIEYLLSSISSILDIKNITPIIPPDFKEAYDQEKYGQYFRPAGISARTGDPVATPKATTPEPKKSTVQETPKSNADTNKQNSKAEDILAMIRARQQK